MYDALRALVQEVAPRKGHIDFTPDTELGFGGYGMTITEYLLLLERIAEIHGERYRDLGWPRTLAEIVKQGDRS